MKFNKLNYLTCPLKMGSHVQIIYFETGPGGPIGTIELLDESRGEQSVGIKWGNYNFIYFYRANDLKLYEIS